LGFSSDAPDKPNGRRREPIAADSGKQTVIQRGVAFEPIGNVVLKPVVTPDLIEQFGHEARDATDFFNLKLPPQMRWVLIV